MENKDKGDGIEDSLLDMLLVILLEGASVEVSWLVTPSLAYQARSNIIGHIYLHTHPPAALLPGFGEHVIVVLLLGFGEQARVVADKT